MTTIRLKYVKRYERNGDWYHYFRRKGCAPVALPGPPGSREFMAAYDAALSNKPLRASKHDAGSMACLIADFYKSVDFQNLKPKSQRIYHGVLDRIAKKHGHRKVRDMGRSNARKIVEEVGAAKPAMGNLVRSILKRLMRFAIDTDLRDDNPVVGIGIYKIGTRHTWTDAQLAAYEKRWPIGTQERLDYACLIFSGQRGGDVVRMLRPDRKATTVKVVQEKTGAELTLPIVPEWRRVIDATPAKGLYLLGDDAGRPIKRDALTLRIKRAAKLAGLPSECKAHGLRKALARRLAESGKSAKEIAAVTGHKTLKEIERYTAAADQARLAEQAMSNFGNVKCLTPRKPLKSGAKK